MGSAGPSYFSIIIVILLIITAVGFVNAKRKKALGGKGRLKTNQTPTTPNMANAGTCPKCGATLDPGANFCAVCGAEVKLGTEIS